MTSTEKTLTATIIALAVVIAGLAWSHVRLVERVNAKSDILESEDEIVLLEAVNKNTERIEKLEAR